MQYAMASGWRKNASDAQINDRLKSQGHNSLSDVSLQQRDKIKNGGLVGGLYGVGYDISDTEGPNDFFNAPGLLNNLDGTLTDSAVADNDMWMKKLQDLKANDPQAQISDKDKKRELASTEDGKATIYLEAIEKLCSASRYDGGWGDLNITINNSDDKILAYLLTVEDIAKKKIETSGWKNKTNVDRTRVYAIPVYDPCDKTYKEKESVVKKRAQEVKKKEEAKKADKYKISVIINIILVICVIVMFWVATVSDVPNILNYKRALEDKYAAWEEELDEREAIVRQKEKELRLTEE
jgi:hypothetical protein